MASIKKLKSGRWQAQVARGEIRKAKSFQTKQEAKDWAARLEYLALKGELASAPGCLRDIFDRYAREVSPKKRGARWEIIRFERLKKDRLADVRLADLKPSHFADWRDRRLSEVAPASVNREMGLMSAALNVARREWGLIAVNPMSDVRKPSKPPPRDRRVSEAELTRLLERVGSGLQTLSARAVHAFRFAIETGMRAGEIVGLTWEDINTETRVASLALTKNGTARQVPLSTEAIRLLGELPGTTGPCFQITSVQLDVLFRKVRDAVKIDNLRFHDSRHEAITRMARKLDVLSLARVVGHKDIRMLQIYYNETAEELALRLG